MHRCANKCLHLPWIPPSPEERKLTGQENGSTGIWPPISIPMICLLFREYSPLKVMGPTPVGPWSHGDTAMFKCMEYPSCFCRAPLLDYPLKTTAPLTPFCESLPCLVLADAINTSFLYHILSRKAHFLGISLDKRTSPGKHSVGVTLPWTSLITGAPGDSRPDPLVDLARGCSKLRDTG